MLYGKIGGQVTKKGKDIKPLDKLLIQGTVMIVESIVPSSNGKFNRLYLTNGIAWPVNNEEELIFLGIASQIELLGFE